MLSARQLGIARPRYIKSSDMMSRQTTVDINVWNKLSTDCVHASSVNMFKNKIDKYLAKAGYT